MHTNVTRCIRHFPAALELCWVLRLTVLRRLALHWRCVSLRRRCVLLRKQCISLCLAYTSLRWCDARWLMLDAQRCALGVEIRCAAPLGAAQRLCAGNACHGCLLAHVQQTPAGANKAVHSHCLTCSRSRNVAPDRPPMSGQLHWSVCTAPAWVWLTPARASCRGNEHSRES